MSGSEVHIARGDSTANEYGVRVTRVIHMRLLELLAIREAVGDLTKQEMANSLGISLWDLRQFLSNRDAPINTGFFAEITYVLGVRPNFSLVPAQPKRVTYKPERDMPDAVD